MTAADQPTTEPSDEAIATLRDDLQGARDRLADALNARYEAVVARAERAEAALLARAPQPAADAETEVQWGVRRLDGMVAPYGRKHDALRRIAAMGGTLVSIREEA